MTASRDSAVDTTILSRRFIVFPPKRDHNLARHSKNLSPQQFAASVLGKVLFKLSDEAIALMVEHDVRPLYHLEFLNLTNCQILVDRALTDLDTQLEVFKEQECMLGAWLFSFTAGVASRSLWGPDAPWTSVEGLMDDFYVFQNTFEGLFIPFPSVTARTAYRARKALISKFRKYGEENMAEPPDTPQQRLNLVAIHDTHWASNPDYYIFEVIIALAILSTVGNMSIWLLRHVLADQEVCQKIRDEVAALACCSDTDNESTIDFASVRDTCPWLVASWHEILRLHMTGIPREATRNFDLQGERSISIRRGDILLLPMSETNRDPELFADPEKFHPARFIGADGRFSREASRKTKVFGAAGSLCPGRYYAFGVIIPAIGALLHLAEINPVGGKWPALTASKGIAGGFERVSGDVRVRISRRADLERTNLRLKFSRNLFQFY